MPSITCSQPVAQHVPDGRAADGVAAADHVRLDVAVRVQGEELVGSDAPGEQLPVPKTMPVAPSARKLPTAVEESMVWSVS